ncbi:MAG: hypothetical protein WD232_10740 [Acidimicrobiales bacterium]
MTRSPLALVGVAVAAWASIPPYVGPALATDPVVEVVDHVVPAVVVLAVSLAALAAGARARGTAMFGAGLVVALAGLWMVATHVPLLAQAARDEAPWVASLWHFVPGVAVVALGAVWALRWSTDTSAE